VGYSEVSILYFQKVLFGQSIAVLTVDDGEVEEDSEAEVLVVAGVDSEVEVLAEVDQVDVGKIEREKVKTLPPIKSMLWL
jgi:hypothetical protein